MVPCHSGPHSSKGLNGAKISTSTVVHSHQWVTWCHLLVRGLSSSPQRPLQRTVSSLHSSWLLPQQGIQESTGRGFNVFYDLASEVTHFPYILLATWDSPIHYGRDKGLNTKSQGSSGAMLEAGFNTC